MTSVGYGDITPKNTEERAFVILIMIMGSGIHAIIINDVSKIVNNFNVLAE